MEIGKMTLKELRPYDLAYQKEIDNNMDLMKVNAWWNGIYSLNAINSSVVGNSQWYVGKNHTATKYPKKPFGLDIEEHKKEIQDEEASEYFAMLEMKNSIAMWSRTGLPDAPD